MRLSEGKVVEIANASMRDNEVHLGGFSEIKVINEELKGVIVEGEGYA